MDSTTSTPPPPLPPPFPGEAPRRSWWNRNWKWFVPTGCLSLFLLFLAGIAVVVFAALSILKSGDVYKTAVARARANPAVTAALGTPIKEGLFPLGSKNTFDGADAADLTIPISGPKGKGTIHAVADKADGAWTYSALNVEVKQTHERIDLNENDAAAGNEE